MEPEAGDAPGAAEDDAAQPLALADMHPPPADEIYEKAVDLQSPRLTEWPDRKIARQRIISKINSVQRSLFPPPYGKAGSWNDEALDKITDWLRRASAAEPSVPLLALPAPPPMLALPAPPVIEEGSKEGSSSNNSSDNSSSDSDMGSDDNDSENDKDERNESEDGEEALRLTVIHHDSFLDVERERNELEDKVIQLTSELEYKDARIKDLENDGGQYECKIDALKYELAQCKKQRRD